MPQGTSTIMTKDTKMAKKIITFQELNSQLIMLSIDLVQRLQHAIELDDKLLNNINLSKAYALSVEWHKIFIKGTSYSKEGKYHE